MNCKNKFCFVKTNILKVFALFTEIKGLVVSTKQRGPNYNETNSSLQKIILAHPESFQHFSISFQDLLNTLSEDRQ